MKFIAFFENNKEDLDETIKVAMQVGALRAKEPDKLPKIEAHYNLAGDLPKLTDAYKGFVIYEADNIDQMANLLLLWHPVKSRKWYFLPLYEGQKGLELYMKMK